MILDWQIIRNLPNFIKPDKIALVEISSVGRKYLDFTINGQNLTEILEDEGPTILWKGDPFYDLYKDRIQLFSLYFLMQKCEHNGTKILQLIV